MTGVCSLLCFVLVFIDIGRFRANVGLNGPESWGLRLRSPKPFENGFKPPESVQWALGWRSGFILAEGFGVQGLGFGMCSASLLRELRLRVHG